MNEISFTLSDNTEVRGVSFNPLGICRGVVVFVHGIGEHFGRYAEWASGLAKEGFAVFGADLPGHGLSGGKRGHILSYNLIDEFISKLISLAGIAYPEAPAVLYGHSLGGGIVLRHLLKMQPLICCAVVTSPWLKLSFEPPKFKVMLAKVVKNIAPSMVQSSGLTVDHLSRDQNVVRDYERDPLVHGLISVSLFNEAMSAAEYSLQNARMLSVPLLLMHGSDDKIVSPEGSRLFASDNANVELKMWDGGSHELHNDIIKEDVFAYIIEWLGKKAANKKTI